MSIRMNIIMPDELYHKIKFLSEEDGRTISGLIRLLIKKWIKERERGECNKKMD